jgi:prophage antirepressor-like protein
MDNKMAVFNNREFGSIRVIEENGNYLFCGFDVAKALGYAKPRNAINTHCKGALKRGALTEGGVQELTFIPEGDVYRLIVHSRLPGAERFEKWVFDEVLPMIRKTGGYMTASLLEQAAEKPEILLAFADQLLAEHEKNRQLSGEVERLRPKADFYDAFVHEENCTNIRPQVAFIRKAPPFSCGGERLARESAGEDGNGFKSCFFKKRLLRECGDVAELRHIRPMFLQDGIGIVRPLALTDRFKARRLRRKVQPADAGKQADMGELIHG